MSFITVMKNSFILGLIILLISCSKQEIEKEIVPVVPVVPVAEFVQFAVTQAKFAQSLKLIKREVSYLISSALLKNIRMFSYDGDNRCTEIKRNIIIGKT